MAVSLGRSFGSLTVRNYRLYFFGQMVSLSGTWMQRTAQAWLVLQLTGSPAALGTVTALQFLPITALTLFGGVLADRWPKRRTLVIAQVGCALQALILGLLVLTGTVELWHVYVLALMLGLFNAFDGPVRQSFAAELVGKEHLVNAVALNTSVFQVARIAGPSIGGLMIARFGVAPSFLVNAASYVIVIGALLLMRESEMYRGSGRKRATGNVFRQIGEGVRYAAHTPSVTFIFIMLAAIGTFGFNFTVVIPLVAEFVLKVGAEKFGFLTSCMGVGSLIAALSLASLGNANMKVLIGAAVVFAAMLGCIALSGSYPLTAGLLMVFGAASVYFSTTANTTVQVLVPDELRGRVMSIFFLLMAGSTPIGGFFTGIVAEQTSVRTAILLEAVLCGAGVVVALMFRSARRARGAGVSEYGSVEVSEAART